MSSMDNYKDRKITEMKSFFIAGFFLAWIVFGGCKEKVTEVWLDELDLVSYSEGIRPVKLNTSYLSDTLQIGGVSYKRGFGSITIAVFSFDLNGNARRFVAEVGADDRGNKELPVNFYVLGDREVLFESGPMKPGDPAIKIDVGLKGIKRLGLLVTDDVGGINNRRTYCNWANARLEMVAGHMPQPVTDTTEKYILTPQPGENPDINSPKIFGVTPGYPFLYTIAATGKRPFRYFAENLPDGLVLDPESGMISGKISRAGEYNTILIVSNELGEAKQELKIVAGEKIALTPPMGWNGWNSWASGIDQEKVIASAESIVNKGLRDHGWTYVNIDDTWQGVRGGKFQALQPNEKFPDIKGMVDYIHSLGLKAGLYSTPYISSYASYLGGSSDYPGGGETHTLIKPDKQPYMRIGKFRFEENDARQMAEWGFDFLKYDWRIDVNSTERMSQALKKSGRDIVFSISNNAPFSLAHEWARLTNMWRTGPDIKDSWNSLYSVAFTLDKWADFAGPGHWNDPDMMILGNVTIGSEMHPTRLTPDEQYSHVSIYSLLAAPLLIGCPIEQLDDFTLNLLTNDEVIEINQDPLGKPGRLLVDEDGIQIWVKPLEDGSFAVGLFFTADFQKNPVSFFRWGDELAKKFTFRFEKAGLTGKWKLRDVWRQQDLGEFEASYETEINFRGVVLLRMYPV